MIDLDTLTDQQIVARTLDGEAGNQGMNGLTGVGCVIQTRTMLNWQNEMTPRGVCLHREQFSCWLPGADLNRITAPNYVEPPQCMMLADQILKGILTDITGGADSYEVTGTGAYWAKGLTPTRVIGQQSFYITRAQNSV